MTPDNAYLAAYRFGFGLRPETNSLLLNDPLAALITELDSGGNAPPLGNDLISSGEAVRLLSIWSTERKRKRKLAKASADKEQFFDSDTTSKVDVRFSEVDRTVRQIYPREVETRFARAIGAPIGIFERLTWFWSNHFCVSGAKNGAVRVTCGAFEREAIRPHVLGRFSDMLLAVESHPAMLHYLDNVRSIGPHSTAGVQHRKGLNENLAREILELHTVGVGTGYIQADVVSFAKVLSGWSVIGGRDPVRGGEFNFRAEMHEPGAQVVMGKHYPENGIEQGQSVLRDLAQHPSTAQHVASKLAVHFIDDVPPPDLVHRLAKVFGDTGGDLKQVTKALVSSPESWDPRRRKLKRPGEWLVGALRAGGQHTLPPKLTLRMTRELGEPIWQPPSPKGFSDQNDEWLNGVAPRLEIANGLSRNFGPVMDKTLADKLLGPLASGDTLEAVARASDQTQAFTLVVMSPEFLWR